MWATLWDWTAVSAVVLLYATLLLINLAGVLLTALQLPGTWLIVAATAVVAWVRWDSGVLGWWSLVALLALAVLGELLEFFASAAGASNAGATKTAVVLSIVGGIIGAVVGTVALPIPVIGTLLGAAIGAGLGSLGGDMWKGRGFDAAWLGARGAAVGRFWGALGKVIVACLMWLAVLVALFI